jgi:hypothetical protein
MSEKKNQTEKSLSKRQAVATAAAPQPALYYDLAMPSIALVQERKSMPGSLTIRQNNMMALQRRIGNRAIQRLMIQRDGEVPAPEADTPEAAAPEPDDTEETNEEEERHQAFQEGVSTPVPEGATIGEGDATLEVGGASVTILPDATTGDDELAGSAETTGGITGWSTPGFQSEGGVITSFDEVTAPTVSIRTTYGPGASATDTSDYGRGTTEEDTGTGDTSLGFHEGSHGQTTLDYLGNHALPVFTGEVGMTEADFEAARAAYNTAMTEYATDMGEHQVTTVDCVGDEASFCEAEGAEEHEGH